MVQELKQHVHFGPPPVFTMRHWVWKLYFTSETSLGSVGREAGSNGTGHVASIRAGLRMIGKDMGGTPTCSGEARGCRMRGDD